MKTIVLDGVEYELVPRHKQAEPEPIIAQINGYNIFLGPISKEKMTWEQAKDWCKSHGNKYFLPGRVVLLACYCAPDLKEKLGNSIYWAAEEYNSELAWHQSFKLGFQGNSKKVDKSAYAVAARIEKCVT